MLSELSLAEISNISVLNLPIYSFEISNSQSYSFGALVEDDETFNDYGSDDGSDGDHGGLEAHEPNILKAVRGSNTTKKAPTSLYQSVPISEVASESASIGKRSSSECTRYWCTPDFLRYVL